MRRWLRRWAGFRVWRWRRSSVDLAVRCEVLTARGQATFGCEHPPVAALLRDQLPNVSSARVTFLADSGESVTVFLSRESFARQR